VPGPLRAALVVVTFVVAALFALVGLVLYSLADGCFDYCDEPNPFSQRWPWAVWVLPLIWGAMYGAMRLLRAPGAAVRALVLTVYVAGVMSLATWFSEDEVISGDATWLAFWIGSLAAWAALTAALALRTANRG
jgi:hypothetical protein